MFTILHRNEGRDRFYSAHGVERIGPHSNGPAGMTIHIEGEETVRMLEDGEVFVMNAAGATVATYKLGAVRVA